MYTNKHVHSALQSIEKENIQCTYIYIYIYVYMYSCTYMYMNEWLVVNSFVVKFSCQCLAKYHSIHVHALLVILYSEKVCCCIASK